MEVTAKHPFISLFLRSAVAVAFRSFHSFHLMRFVLSVNACTSSISLSVPEKCTDKRKSGSQSRAAYAHMWLNVSAVIGVSRCLISAPSAVAVAFAAAVLLSNT